MYFTLLSTQHTCISSEFLSRHRCKPVKVWYQSLMYVLASLNTLFKATVWGLPDYVVCRISWWWKLSKSCEIMSVVHEISPLLVICDSMFECRFSIAGSSSESEPEVEETEEEKMQKKKQKVFNVAKEIMTSEEEFIDKLKLLNIVSLTS